MIQTASSAVTSSRGQGRSASLWLTWGVALSSVWFMTGLYLDGWAHTHELPDTFFTPWHGVIYSGFLIGALFLLTTWLRRSLRGMPVGYGLSLVGVGLFFVGGVADLLWHTFFGIEANLAAEYSPPHLVLATAGILIATGPLRAAWHAERQDRATFWSAALSLALLLSALTFFTSEFHPFDHPWAWIRFRPREISNSALALPAFRDGGVSTQDLAQAVGTSSIILQSCLLIALLLLLRLCCKEKADLLKWREKSERGPYHERSQPASLPHGVTSSLTSFSCVSAGICAMRSAIET